MRDFGDHRAGLDGVYWVAFQLGLQGSDNHRMLGEDEISKSAKEDNEGTKLQR